MKHRQPDPRWMVVAVVAIIFLLGVNAALWAVVMAVR